MWALLGFFKKNLTWSIPISMVLGLAYGYSQNAGWLKESIVPLTVLMVFPMMVGQDFKKVFSHCSLKPQLTTQLINFGFMPFLAYAVGQVFFPHQPIFAFGLLLAGLIPTSGMTISWTGFARGNVLLAIKISIIGLIAGSFLTPFYANALMGAEIDIPIMGTINSIAIVVFIPLILGYVTREILIKKYGIAKFDKDYKAKFPLLSTLGVIGIIFVAMSLKSKNIIDNPQILITLIPAILVFYGLAYAVSTFIGKKFFSREDAIAIVYGSVMRNLSIALAIAMTVFAEQSAELALILSVAYVIQIQSAAWYVKKSTKIFGPAREEITEDVMHEGFFSLPMKATLRDAIRLLDEEHIHSIVVLGSKKQPIGVVTSEIIINLLAEGHDLDEAKLADIEKLPPVTVDHKILLVKAIEKMKRKHEYEILVTDDNGKIMGEITEEDLLAHIKNNKG